jgi:hypothetical protein
MDSAAHHAAYEHQGGYQSNDKARNLKPYGVLMIVTRGHMHSRLLNSSQSASRIRMSLDTLDAHVLGPSRSPASALRYLHAATSRSAWTVKGLGRFVERLWRSACRALRKHLHAVLWQASSARCYFPRRDAQRMAIQTRFTKKLTRSEDCNDRFLALLGNDRELDLALLDVKNRVRTLSL